MPKTSIKHSRRSRRLQSMQITKAPKSSNTTDGSKSSVPFQCILPDTILAHILFGGGYLESTPQQVTTIRGVCSQFASLAASFCTTFDARPSFRKKKITLSTRTISNIVKFLPSLTHLDLSYLGDAFTDKHMRLLSPLLGQLRVLKLRGTAIGDDGLMDFLGFTHSGRPLKFDNLPLEMLDLSKTSMNDRNKIGPMGMIAVGACCKNLKSLQLSMCKRVDDEMLDLMISPHMKKLEELDLSMCSISAKGCCYLTRLRNLRVVDISSSLGVSGQAIRSMITGYCPKNYDGSGADELSDGEPNCSEEEALVGVNTPHSNLTVIAAQFANNGIDTKLFETLAQRAPNLKSLDVRYYLGNASKCSLSPLKLSVRKLETQGTTVLLSNAKNYI